MQPAHNPEEQTTTLAHVPTEGEAATIIEALKAAGITATMTGGFTAGFIAEAPGDISINVFEQDREKAEQVIRQLEQANESIDWNQVDVGKPEDQ
jgi:hypothetical protein